MRPDAHRPSVAGLARTLGLIGWTLGLSGVVWLAWRGDASGVVLATLGATAAWALAQSTAPDAPEAPGALRRALLLALGAGLILSMAPATLSDDVHRFEFDGAVLRAGISPWAHAPDAYALREIRATTPPPNHAHLATIYPPLAAALFALFGALPGLAATKWIGLLGHLAGAGLVGRFAHARVGIALALFPPALVESGLAGHLDAAIGALLLGGGLAVVRARPWRACAAFAGAIGLKLIGVLGAIVLIRRAPRAAIALLVVFAMALLPLSRAGDADGAPAGIVQYAGRWEGGGLVFPAIERALASRLEATMPSPVPRAPGEAPRIDARPLAPIVAELRSVGLDPFREPVGRGKKANASLASVPSRLLAGPLARGFVAGLWLLGALALAWSRVAPLARLRAGVLMTLALMPQLHPWYLLWALPLEMALGRRLVPLLCVASLATYAPLDGYLLGEGWNPAEETSVVFRAALFLGLGLEFLSSRARPLGFALGLPIADERGHLAADGVQGFGRADGVDLDDEPMALASDARADGAEHPALEEPGLGAHP